MTNGFPRFDLTGDVALVTGAARGLGRAISMALAHAGADIALGLRDVKTGGELAKDIEAIGRRREDDGETKLYYYRARYYDSNKGRFVGEDPIGVYGGDINFYAYAHGIPTTLTDPYGTDVLGALETALAEGRTNGACLCNRLWLLKKYVNRMFS
jgi:RHS repeat-associated protein